MTTATIDRNEAFRTEKLGQIDQARRVVEASRQAMADYDSGKAQAALDADLAQRVADGKIRMTGPDTYRILEGWDRNEIFRVRRATRPQEIPLILPQSGLDRAEDGRALLYTAVPTWHQLEGAGLIEGGTTDIDTVLDKGGINWLAMKEQALYEWKGQMCEAPGQYVLLRSDTGAALGSVGERYTPIQPRQQLGFLQDLAERYDVPFESAGPLNGGRQVFVSMKVPESMTIDAGGLDEQVQQFLVAINDNTGNRQQETVVTPWRPVCGNTNRFALRDAVTRWGTRHTVNWQERVSEARRQLGLSEKYAKAYEAEETQLARTAVTLGEVEELLGQLWESEEDPTLRQRNSYERRIDEVFERFALETSRVGRTAYAAENAITGYLDHDKDRNAGRYINMAAARATASLLGTNDDIKSKAHKLLLERA